MNDNQKKALLFAAFQPGLEENQREALLEGLSAAEALNLLGQGDFEKLLSQAGTQSSTSTLSS